MRTIPRWLLLAGWVFLAGCSSKEFYTERLEPSGTRMAGMTRAELYKKLPPAETPVAFPPSLEWILGAAIYSYHRESHLLADGTKIEILYRLDDIREYATSDLHPKNRERALEKALELDDAPREAQRPVKSAENPDDVVYLVSRDSGEEAAVPTGFSTQVLLDH